MAYKKDDIVYRAKAMLGDSFREGTEERLESLCIAAALELEGRLRVNIDRSDIGLLFVSSASLLAVSMYMELERATAGFESFSAGNLSVKLKNGGGGASSDSLRAQAEKLLRPYMQGDGFDFVGVDT